MWAAYGRDAAISTGKVQLFIFLDHRLNHWMVGLSSNGQTGGNILIVLKSNESLVIQQRRNVPQHLHVGVEIHAAVLLQHDKAHDVGHEGVFSRGIRLRHEGHGEIIAVVLVPLADLKIRAELLPAGDALLGKFRLFAAAKPAVVDDLWDHGFTSRASKSAYKAV